MKTVTLQVSNRDAVTQRVRGALAGKKQGAHISFASADVLFRLLTSKRWEILRAMTGAGPLTIRETARRLGRDVKAVHGDVRTLLDAGILRKTETGKVEFPFDEIHVDVTLKAA